MSDSNFQGFDRIYPEQYILPKLTEPSDLRKASTCMFTRTSSKQSVLLRTKFGAFGVFPSAGTKRGQAPILTKTGTAWDPQFSSHLQFIKAPNVSIISQVFPVSIICFRGSKSINCAIPALPSHSFYVQTLLQTPKTHLQLENTSP